MDEALVNFRAMDLMNAIQYGTGDVDSKIVMLVEAIGGQQAAWALGQIPKEQHMMFLFSLYVFTDTRVQHQG